MFDVKYNISRFGGLAFLLILVTTTLFTCEKVPDYCGTGELYDPNCEFCYGDKAYRSCKDGKYNPLTSGCDKEDRVGSMCSDGSVVPLGTPCGGYTVSAAVTPSGVGGVITRTQDKPNYAAGDKVILSVDDNDAGYDFIGWAGEASSVLPSVTITMSGMSANKPLVAMFKRKDVAAVTYRLVTTAFPEYGGGITRNPNTAVYNPNQQVTVTAQARQGYDFVGWSGASTSKNTSVTVTMSESKTLVAVFTPKLYNIKVNVTGSADGGAVFINGTALAANSSRKVEADIVVFAKAAEGYVFTGWSGAAASAGTANPAKIRVTGDGMTISANFKERSGGGGGGTTQQAETYTLTVNDRNPTGGSVTLTPDLKTYGIGASVTATATAQAGYKFKEWTGSAAARGTTANPITIMMDGNKTLSATFEDNPGGDSDTAGPTIPPTPPDYEANKCGVDGTAASCGKKVMPDGKTWMTENLNFTPRSGNSWCYDNSTDSCAKYGRLYDWETAMTVCPTGWRLPDTSDWNNLVTAAGGQSTAGSKLKSSSGWDGTVSTGFEALPGGFLDIDSKFYNVGTLGFWWTADVYSNGSYYKAMYSNEDYVLEALTNKNFGYSVRCVSGNGTPPPPTGKTYTVNFEVDSRYSSFTDITITVDSGEVIGNKFPTAVPITDGTAGPDVEQYVFEAWANQIGNIYTPSFPKITADTRLFASWKLRNYTNGCGVDGNFYSCPHGNVGGVINSNVWMTENLNYQTQSGSWCYDNNPENCNKYGRLYDWNAAKAACSSMGEGWHLPDTADWSELVSLTGGYETAGTKLKSISGWDDVHGETGGGTYYFGFNAVPGGRGIYNPPNDPIFDAVGKIGEYWTASEDLSGNGYAYVISMIYGARQVDKSFRGIEDGYSVRCVKKQ